MSDLITRLNAALEGRYVIERELGEGGMATVYLADDLKHGRKVALKVLKPELAALLGAERFLAEIKTTANLQHPHILPLFDSGEEDGFLFYVMPYVEGESLRQRLDRDHQLPVEEAVSIATAVASALDYAHRQGVIHRDIKPANLLMHDGQTVVSDFGIALAVSAGGGGRLTETGLSMGTPHYMSPEQATGDQSVGTGTDIYAAGCVLYEMLVGEPPYTGGTPQAILGRIITGDLPSASAQRASVPPNVEAAIAKALEKVPADRFTVAGEFARALGDTGFRHGAVATAEAAAVAGPSRRLTLAFAGLAGAFALAFAWALLRPPPSAPLARFSSPFEAGQLPVAGMEFTPDDSALVYSGSSESGQALQLWIRRWSQLEAEPIPGTEGTVSFALSPDGREVAFVAGFPGPLRVVPLSGGPSRTLADQVFTVSDWAPDGSIYVTTTTSHLARVPVAGQPGELEVLNERLEGESIHGFLRVLPGGSMGIFQVWHAVSGEDSEIWSIDLATGDRSFLVLGHDPLYASTGHLLFVIEDVLMAAPLDPRTAELGVPVSVAEGLATEGQYGLSFYAVSEGGTLVYATAGFVGDVELVWVTREGVAESIDGGLLVNRPANEGWSLSPDGTRIAVAHEVDGNADIWVKTLPDGPFERITSDDAEETYPSWTPDGEFVTYVRNQPDERAILRRRADGTGVPEMVFDDHRDAGAAIWSPDGDWLLLRRWQGAGRNPGDRDILGFRPGVDSVAIPLVATEEFAEQQPALSPNGRWLAYTSNESGRTEVYVRPFPDVDVSPVRVSTDGGSRPLWAHSGRELFFRTPDRAAVAATVEAESDFRILQRETLYNVGAEFLLSGSIGPWDVAPDDQRFLMARGFTAQAPLEVVLVQNWFQELEQRLGN